MKKYLNDKHETYHLSFLDHNHMVQHGIKADKRPGYESYHSFIINYASVSFKGEKMNPSYT